MKIRLSRVHYPVEALGPGCRVGIWVQGCSIHCAGCVSRDTWDPEGGRAVGVEDLIGRIAELSRGGLDGVTITGGEPFDQPGGLMELLVALRTWGGSLPRPIDLLVYSGYPLERLRLRHKGMLALLDAVIVGPYQRRKPTRLIWRGSANQEIIPLTELGRRRYEPYVEFEPAHPRFQVMVDDSVWLIGVPRDGDMERLEAALQLSGVQLEGASWRA